MFSLFFSLFCEVCQKLKYKENVQKIEKIVILSYARTVLMSDKGC
ncbi:hypothetical protein CHCC20335_1113 [Bacillus paralicheniformis]|nr:hypothetical protein CHCC20335_1113 [Bacillus paralicheniformis]